MTEAAGEWIDAARAAERLGVKPATLYAYVSRGVLRRRRAPDGRRSLFDPAEIEELARRGRPRRPPGASELVIESRITALGDDRPYYRGRDALGLASSHAFEAVAEWLWSGADPAPDGPRWRSRPEAVAVARAAQSGLPEETLPLDRLQVIAAALAAADPLRLVLDPPAVIAVGRQLIAGMVDALPAVAGGGESPEATAAPRPPEAIVAHRPAESSIAARLWPRLTSAEPRPPAIRALNAALVLLADHELAASTLAARVAASVRADPYAVVTAGLGAAGGGLHGGASLGAEALLAEIGAPGRAARVIGERLRRGERVPGFGGVVYQARDGRAGCLLDLVRAAAPGHERLAVAEAVLAEARSRGLPGVNIDFALATLGAATGMGRGVGEAIFAVARTAGWLAHALEEYARGTPLRPRAIYTGPPRGR
ncbi:citrate synthase [Actinoallomurus liliacearum]|uniref:citrate synthase (unknown stereospecificity) n=1 Tax=Actinoallomurus liliacearum TaxID=1080073 RepID=A0ABP8TPY2_9ACTN